MNITSYIIGIATAGLIGVFTYIGYRFRNSSNAQPKEKTHNGDSCIYAKSCPYIHKRDMIYISLIFVLIVIVFATKALYPNENFADQLSFAGMVSSIILSVLAIIVTLFGEAKSASAKDTLIAVASDLKESGEKIQRLADTLDRSNLEELKDKIDVLQGRLEDAISAIMNIQETITLAGPKNSDVTFIPTNSDSTEVKKKISTRRDNDE